MNNSTMSPSTFRNNKAFFLVVLAALALSASACGSFDFEVTIAEEGSGTKYEETLDLDLSAVDTIEVDGDWNVDLTVAAADQASVDVVIDDNFEEYLDVKVDGSTLQIAFERGNLDPKVDPTATVALPRVDRVEVSGDSSLDMRGDVTTLAEVTVDGDSAISINDVDVSTLNLSLSGDSEASVSGAAETGNLDLDGDSSVNLYGLTLKTADISVNGDSELLITATDQVTGEANGDSNIYVDGGASIDVATSGDSTIQAR